MLFIQDSNDENKKSCSNTKNIDIIALDAELKTANLDILTAESK